MRREQRLTKRNDFTAVYRKGRAFGHPLIALRLLPNERPFSRYGFVVSKAVGNAVVRNRVRRRLREGIRSLPVEPGWDIVVIARPKAAAAGAGRRPCLSPGGQVGPRAVQPRRR